MAVILYALYALLALALLFPAAWSCRAAPTPAAYVSFPVALGLLYDNVVLALGAVLVAGPLLLALNWPRYLLQALVAPLFLPIFADLYRRARPLGRFARLAWPLALAATLALMGYGLTGLGTLELLPTSGFGITRYASAAIGPPVIGVAIAGAALAAGAAIWRACGWPWLVWAALALLIGSGTSAALGRDVMGLVTNAGELLLLAAVLACARHLHVGYVMPRRHMMARR